MPFKIMRICFYAPFKPLNHPHPSGDLAIAKGLIAFLSSQGHTIRIVSSLRTRWIYGKPLLWPRVIVERQRAVRLAAEFRPHLWLTYHTYYKAPDMLGPAVCRACQIPYIIFQGIFSTRRRRHIKTVIGYHLNRNALLSARHLLTNRREDEHNLRRLIPEHRLTYVTPGIEPENFVFSARARDELRRRWGIAEEMPVVLSAAMFRPGVKTEGLVGVIRACGRLMQKDRPFELVIAGEGSQRPLLEQTARQILPGRVRFAGNIPPCEMARYYSAADVFAFPGIRESLGMVYLEAQSCGLPVIAFDNGGIPEVVRHGATGILVPPFCWDTYARTIDRLLQDTKRRRAMGDRAAAYVRKHHDLYTNYRRMEEVLKIIACPAASPCHSEQSCRCDMKVRKTIHR
jgi:glycosyltransferase involved in cell wall biosynthesis